MPMKSLQSMLVPLMLSGAYVLSACASQPIAPPVVAKCPRFPEPPPSLLSPPQAPNALNELQTLLAIWVDVASSMPPPSVDGSTGTLNKPQSGTQPDPER